MTISMVGGFVHLYHVWAIWGAITAVFFGRAAYRNWVRGGGQWRSAPGMFGEAVRDTLQPIAGDWLRLIKWFFAGMLSFSLKRGAAGWPVIDTYWPGPKTRRWPPDHTLLIGITLGGMARFFTAMYWAEKNVAWMTEASVLVPAIPIIWMILADHSHQLTTWPRRPWIARMILSLGILWTVLGLINACPMQVH